MNYNSMITKEVKAEATKRNLGEQKWRDTASKMALIDLLYKDDAAALNEKRAMMLKLSDEVMEVMEADIPNGDKQAVIEAIIMKAINYGKESK